MKNYIKYPIILITLFSLGSCVMKSKYDDLDTRTKDMNQKIDALKQNISDLEQDLAEQKAENEKLNLRNEELSQVNRKLVDKNKDLAMELTDIRRKSINLETELEKKKEKLDEILSAQKSLEHSLKREIREGNIKIQELKGMLKVNVVSEVLFESGSHVVRESGKEVLSKVADSLKKITDKRIEVQGHTDDQKITGKLQQKYPTNWELSAARATTVARYLQDHGVNPKLLSAAGFSKYHPVATNDTAEGRAQNRRIELILMPIIGM